MFWAWHGRSRSALRRAAGIAGRADRAATGRVRRRCEKAAFPPLALLAPDVSNYGQELQAGRCSRVVSRPWGDCGRQPKGVAWEGAGPSLRHALWRTASLSTCRLPDPLLELPSDGSRHVQRRDPQPQHPGHQGGCGPRPVNLERPCASPTGLGGHLVQRHVDGLAMFRHQPATGAS